MFQNQHYDHGDAAAEIAELKVINGCRKRAVEEELSLLVTATNSHSRRWNSIRTSVKSVSSWCLAMPVLLVALVSCEHQRFCSACVWQVEARGLTLVLCPRLRRASK